MLMIGTKSKEDALISDFTPEESDEIMLKLSNSIKEALGDVDEEHLRDDERLKTLKVKTRDGSFSGEIRHVPMDPFGEKHAEVRAVLNIVPEMRPFVEQAFTREKFAVGELGL